MTLLGHCERRRGQDRQSKRNQNLGRSQTSDTGLQVASPSPTAGRWRLAASRGQRWGARRSAAWCPGSPPAPRRTGRPRLASAGRRGGWSPAVAACRAIDFRDMSCSSRRMCRIRRRQSRLGRGRLAVRSCWAGTLPRPCRIVLRQGAARAAAARGRRRNARPRVPRSGAVFLPQGVTGGVIHDDQPRGKAERHDDRDDDEREAGSVHAWYFLPRSPRPGLPGRAAREPRGAGPPGNPCRRQACCLLAVLRDCCAHASTLAAARSRL